MRLVWIFFLLSVISLTGCGGDDDSSPATTTSSATTSTPATTPVTTSLSPTGQLIATSLHGTTRGMGYFYAKEQGGFEQFTHVAYQDLPCQNCHVKADQCNTCHEKTGDRPANAKCLQCHKRQGAEQMFSADHHLAPKSAGGLEMSCADCHSAKQIHGDGKQYNSLNENPNKANCEQSGCHAKLNRSKPMHLQHNKDLDCAACHVKVTPSCYTCHFTQQDGFAKNIVFQPPITSWKLLVKSKATGKITTGGLQTITSYQGHAFYALSPFFAHTIPEKSGVTCATCHSSPAVEEYREQGTMTLTRWDEAKKSINSMSGVIPVPLDWKSALRMDFLTQDAAGNWVFLKNAADSSHMLFAEPIDVSDIPDLPSEEVSNSEPSSESLE